MLKNEKRNNYIDGGGFIIISSLIAFTLAIITFYSDITIGKVENFGLFVKSANLWLERGIYLWSLNILILATIAIVITLCNNHFQFIRNFTRLIAAIFVIISCCNISACNMLIGGNLSTLAIIISISLLYLTYQNRNPVLIYILFALIATCCIFQYAYLTLIPVFILGTIQMKAINLKTILAIVIGLITPFWIVFGLHIYPPSDIRAINMVSITQAVVLTDSPIFIYNLVTAFITFLLLIKNMVTIYSFPPQERAYNGILTLLTLWSIAMPMIDYHNSNSYMPTLYLCCAIQVAHAFTSSSNRYKYMWVITLILAYLSLYTWQLL